MTPDVPFYRGLFSGLLLAVLLVWGPLAIGVYVVLAR
jgi:hypothetical protein